MKIYDAANKKSAVENGEKVTTVKRDPLTAMLLPSVMGILLCLIMLCSATWAWFSSTQAGQAAPIKSADYTLTIQVKEGGTAVEFKDNKFTAEADTEYVVTMTASGSASTGFCTISLPYTGEDGTQKTKVLFTEQIKNEGTLTFKIKLTSTAEVSFGPQWGTSSKSNSPDVSADDTVTG